MATDNTRLHAVVEGRVQGVGFRYFVLSVASSLGLTGWVRNLPDGSVEVMAEGQPTILGNLLEALHAGPRSAFVSNVKTEWEPPTGEFPDFRVRGLF